MGMGGIILYLGIIHLTSKRLLTRRLGHLMNIYHKDVHIYQSDTTMISGRLLRVECTTHLRPV